MQLALTTIEARVLGALIEKEITTPEYYPLSLNALTNACNQKSNRDPVLRVEESDVRKALNHLEYQSLVRSVSSTDSRVTKFEHRLQDAFNFYRPEVAIICELLVRGPQTPGELRTRASRMHAFADLESVHSALSRLEKRELGAAPPVAPSAPAHATAARDHDVAAPSSNERIEALVAEVAELRSQISDLQSQFATFRKQFE